MSNKKTIIDPLDQLQMEHLNKAKEEAIPSLDEPGAKIINDSSNIRTTEKQKKQNKIKFRRYSFYTTDEMLEKIYKYSLLKIKGKSEAINELLKMAFKIVEKDEPMPEISPSRDFMKIIKEIKNKDTYSEKQELAIK